MLKRKKGSLRLCKYRLVCVEVSLCSLRLSFFRFVSSVEFPPLRVTNKKRKRKADENMSELVVQEKPILEVTPYHIPNRGPYPFNKPKK